MISVVIVEMVGVTLQAIPKIRDSCGAGDVR